MSQLLGKSNYRPFHSTFLFTNLSRVPNWIERVLFVEYKKQIYTGMVQKTHSILGNKYNLQYKLKNVESLLEIRF